MIETDKTEYFDLTPRKRAMILEAAQELASAANIVEVPDRSGPPFVAETSRRGRALGRSGGIAKGSPNCQPTLDKENVANVEAACTPGGKSTLTKAALKRRQVVEDLAQAQADARSRLCIFKTKTDATIGDNADAEAGDRMESAAQAFETSVGSRAACQGYSGELTVAQGPVLRTAIRSSSRDGRSLSIPMRGLHSVGEVELSQRSRGSSREQAPLEQSVRSMQSMRSVRSMQTIRASATSVNYGSLVGRSVCTRPLTFPTGPVLATEARSRSHSVGARTPPAGTPEKHSRSVSASSSRSVSRTPSQLTVPRAPLLATELRSRSRSVGVRTPSHSVGTPERSVQSCCPMSVPNGSSVRNRSCSVDMRTPSAKTASKGPLKPHRPRSRSHSVDMRTPTYTPNVTVPKGPVLSTELRSRSRLRTPSAHSVGTPERERSVRSCLSPESYHSCSSARESSVRSRNGQPRPLTVPVGPLLETEIRSHRCCRSAVSQVEQEEPQDIQAQLNPEVVETDSASAGETLQCEEAEPRNHRPADRAASSEEQEQVQVMRHHGRRKCKSPGAASDADAASREEEEEKLNLPEEPECVSPLSLPEEDARSSLPTTPRANNAHAEVVMRVVAQLTNTSARSSFDAAVDKPVPLRPDSLATNIDPPLSSLLDFLPGCEDAAIPVKPDESCVQQQATTIGNELQESLCDSSDITANAESRAASRKQEVLAKVAEEHANIRKQRFVFGKPGTTPIRTPTRKTVGDQSRAEVGINKIGSLV